MCSHTGEVVVELPADAQQAEDVILPSEAAERKRVLNILAQRRYRRRRRERQAALEKMVLNSTTTAASPLRPTQSNTTDACTQPSNAETSPSSDDTDTPTDDIMPYTNGSTWTPPIWDADPGFSNLIANSSWSTDANSYTFNLDDFLQSDDIEYATFSDDWTIAVPELDLLRAAYNIGTRLQSAQLLFAGLEAQSIFLTSDCSAWINTLPKNLQPTTAQLTIPHHPIIDILPWPVVRTRLVNMYSMPPDLWPRHPSDGSASSLVRLVYDMEDGGVRVTGSDPACEHGWEIEQRFFEIWWWALDQSVIRNSDRKRLMRGQPKLSCVAAVGT